ncbi:MAG: tetratricopeptide repeat protein [Nibricoccus sp.]
MISKSDSPHPTWLARSRRDAAAFAIFAGLALLVYWPALQGPFIYDDFHHVTRPELRTWTGLVRIWTSPWETAQYYPVIHSFFWLQQKLWGDAVVGYHTVNVFLHTTAAVLLVTAIKKLGFCRGAYWGALLFLLHPVAVESVGWISEQKNTLSCIFFLSSALVYLKFHDSRSAWKYTAAVLFFVLALLSKSVTATLPAVLLVVLWWRNGSLRWRRDILPLVPWFLVGAAAGLNTAWLEKHSIGAEGAAFTLGATERVLLAGRVFWFYLGKALCPTGLIFNYPRWTIDAGEAWQYIFPFGAVALVGAAAWFARKHRGPLAWLLVFGGLLFPVLGFFNVYPFRFSYVADHFMYLNLVPLAVGAAALAEMFFANPLTTAKITIQATAVVALLFLGVASRQHSRIFANEEGFYWAILARNPKSALAHYNLGTLLAKQPGNAEKAIAEYRAAIESDPSYAEAYNNLGMLLVEQPNGRTEAAAAFTNALALMPDLVEANFNLALLLLADDTKKTEALRLMEKAVQLRPKLTEGHYQLGRIYEQSGRTADAKAAYQRAIELRPDHVAAHYNLGLLLAENPTELPEAEAQLATSVRLDPSFAEAHYSLGAVRARLGKQNEAIDSYRTALRLAPDFAEAHNNLGRLLAHKPDSLAEALEHFEAALRLNPSSIEARRNRDTALRALSKR